MGIVLRLSRYLSHYHVVTPYHMLRIASGSYEGCLFGWTAENGQLKQEWGFKTCPGAVRCLAVNEKGAFLVLGSVDERIHIFDLQSHRSI